MYKNLRKIRKKPSDMSIDAYKYCGAICPKCNKGINHEHPINDHEEIREKKRKKYGNDRLCNDCLMSFVGEKMVVVAVTKGGFEIVYTKGGKPVVFLDEGTGGGSYNTNESNDR